MGDVPSNTANEKKDEDDEGERPWLVYDTLVQFGVAIIRLWTEGSLFRKPKEILTYHNPLVRDFEYSKLPSSTSIRLLEITSGQGTGELIQCLVHTVDLKEAPEFIALSYSWEKDMSLFVHAMEKLAPKLTALIKSINFLGRYPRVMLCNQERITIEENLYECLLHLRQQASGYYWIDALCMNQEDHVEKVQQLQMMGEIYGAAESVTVWLGTCPQILSPGVARLESTKGDLMALQALDNERFEPLDSVFERVMFSTFGSAYLLSRRWFKRLWVLQEFCLARQVHLQLGEHRISPETVTGIVGSVEKWLIAAGVIPFSDRERTTFMNVLRPMWGEYVNFIPAILDSRQAFERGTKWSIKEWLRMTRGRQATDPRDFVNAGLGIIRPEELTIDANMQIRDDEMTGDGTDNDIKLWPRLHATSGKELLEVMVNLAACFLTQSQDVSLLSIASLDSGPTAHPSWVPNPSWAHSLDVEEGRPLEPLINLDLGTKFTTCTKSLANPSISRDGRGLHLDAARFAVIEHVVEPLFNTDMVLDTPAHLIEFLEFAARIPVKYGPRGECGLGALASTLIVDNRHVHVEPVHGLIQYLHKIYTQIQDRMISLSNPPSPSNAIEGSKDSKSKNDGKRSQDPSPEEAKVFAVRLKEMWEKLKSLYPQQSWPPSLSSSSSTSSDEEPSSEKSSGCIDEPSQEEERDKELGQEGKSEEQSVDKENSNKNMAYAQAVAEVNLWRALFLTQDGHLGQGPSPEKGDVVMLVASGQVPYIFESAESKLRKKAGKLEKKLYACQEHFASPSSDAERREKQATLKDEIDIVRGEIAALGDNIAWLLKGEGYVHGIMYGEAMHGQEEPRFERIAIV